jgi:deazaflavin-dependent oxidoreductase (nitroreductase family)
MNRYVTNHVVILCAPHLRYMAVIEHRGRKSRKEYRTPVMAFVEDGTISVVLNYGVKSDWVRNIEAAGSAVVVHRGERYKLADLRIFPTDSPELPPGVRAIGVYSRSAVKGTLGPA